MGVRNTCKPHTHLIRDADEADLACAAKPRPLLAGAGGATNPRGVPSFLPLLLLAAPRQQKTDGTKSNRS